MSIATENNSGIEIKYNIKLIISCSKKKIKIYQPYLINMNSVVQTYGRQLLVYMLSTWEVEATICFKSGQHQTADYKIRHHRTSSWSVVKNSDFFFY